MRKKQNAVQYLKGTIQKHQLWQFGAHFLTEIYRRNNFKQFKISIKS